MTNDELDKLEALLAGDVSPAPWRTVVAEQPWFDSHIWSCGRHVGNIGARCADDVALVAALRNAAPGLIAASRGAAEAEEALGAARLDAEMAREAVGMAAARAERAEAALRDLARAAGEVAAETHVDTDGRGHVWGGHVKVLCEAVRMAESVLDDEMPETLPRGAGDTLPAGPLPDATDEAWLLARARGETADHPDPERAAGYVRLEGALRSLPLPEMPPGLVERVLKAIDEKGGE